MSEPLSYGPMSVEEYLAFEAATESRLEYVAGYVYAMTGGTVRHDMLIGNVYVALRAAARGGRCRAHLDGVKVRAAHDRIYYPDASVTCTRQMPDSTLLADPCLIVEVTSSGSRRTDHGEKRDAYLAIGTLRAYLIVEQDRRLVTLHRRGDDGAWRTQLVTDAHGDGRIVLPCPAATLTLDAIYEDTEVPPAPPLRVREVAGASG